MADRDPSRKPVYPPKRLFDVALITVGILLGLGLCMLIVGMLQ